MESIKFFSIPSKIPLRLLFAHWRIINPTLIFQHHTSSYTDQKCRVVEDKAFTDVLYPESIYDVVDYILRECVKKEQPVRKCKNCHKYFAIRGRTDTEYCSRVIDGIGRTCRDLGASYLWEEKKKNDEVFKVYRREYKKRFAWIKSGKISQEKFYSWSEEARQQKELCDKGIITLDEFRDWLKK